MVSCPRRVLVARLGDRKAGLLAPGIFAVCLLASIVYLRSLPDAAIPLVGVGSR
jgi:hypothetical protein